MLVYELDNQAVQKMAMTHGKDSFASTLRFSHFFEFYETEFDPGN